MAALVFYIVGTLILVDPAAMLRLVTNGKAAPATYHALTHDDFLAVRGPIVLGLLVLSLLLQAVGSTIGWRP